MFNETVTQALLSALELRDKDSASHCYRVAMLALELGRVLGLNDQDMALLRTGALLHDVGKIGIPDHILLKPAALTEQEWAMMRQHPKYGAELMRSIPELQAVIPIVLSHHERWDGSGYPDRISGERIPFLARVCAITEVFDSLLSDHVYRPAWPREQILPWIEAQSGKAFDPLMVEALTTIAIGF